MTTFARITSVYVCVCARECTCTQVYSCLEGRIGQVHGDQIRMDLDICAKVLQAPMTTQWGKGDGSHGRRHQRTREVRLVLYADWLTLPALVFSFVHLLHAILVA